MEIAQHYRNSYRKLWFESVVEVNGEIWFSASNLNGIFRADRESGESQFVINFPHYPNDALRLYSACVLIKGKIVFAPCSAKDIAVYDIQKNEIKTIELEQKIVDQCKSSLFLAAFEYKGFAYLIGAAYPAILKVDIMNFEIRNITTPFEQYRHIESNYDKTFGSSFVIKNDMLYLPILYRNNVLCMDLNTYKCNFLEVLPQKSRAWDLCIVNDTLLIWGTDFKLSLFNLNTEKIKVFDIENDTKYEQSGAFLIPYKNKVMIFRARSKNVIVFDIDTGKVIGELQNINYFSKGFNKDYTYLLGDAIIMSRCFWSNEYWLLNGTVNEYYAIKENGEIKKRCFIANMSWNMFNYLNSGKEILLEYHHKTVIDFIMYVLERDI